MSSLVTQPSRFRWCYVGIGGLCVALGAVGFAVPGMPSTIFFLIALWAFSRGSERLHDWLYTHRLFGPALQAWSKHRVIPPRAKALAVAFMALSLAILTFFVAESWVLPAAVGAVLAAVATYIVTRPSRPPLDVSFS